MADKSKRRLWTDDELNFLKENYLVMTYRQLADELGRTERAVSIRISKMGLNKNGNRGRRETPAAVDSDPDEAKANLSPTILTDHWFGPVVSPEKVKRRELTYENSDQLVDPRSKEFFILDFSGHHELYQWLIEAAAAAFRTPELQILYYCNEALNGRSQ